jgi:hypothetical protein
MFWHAAMPIWVGGYEAGPLDSTLQGVVFAVFVRGGRASEFVTRNKYSCHHPRRRMIQYSRDVSV